MYDLLRPYPFPGLSQLLLAAPFHTSSEVATGPHWRKALTEGPRSEPGFWAGPSCLGKRSVGPSMGWRESVEGGSPKGDDGEAGGRGRPGSCLIAHQLFSLVFGSSSCWQTPFHASIFLFFHCVKSRLMFPLVCFSCDWALSHE